MLKRAFVLCLIPCAAFAQQPQPITLSPDEYQTLVNELASRDPAVKFLIDKQMAAQRAAQKPPAAGGATAEPPRAAPVERQSP